MQPKTSTPDKHLSPLPIVIGFLVLEIIIVSMGMGQWSVSRHHSLARKYAKEKRYADSISHYQRLLEKYPEAPALNYELGKVYLQSGQYEEAIERLQIAALSEGPPPKILTQLGVAYMGAKQTEDALEFFKEAMREDPGDPVAAFFIGEHMYRRGEHKLAARFLEKAAFHPEYGKKAQQYLKEIEKKVLGELAEG